jgi:hypothetical protein
VQYCVPHRHLRHTGHLDTSQAAAMMAMTTSRLS